MGARCVTQSTWRPTAVARSFCPTASATRPPMPASTSSNTMVGTCSAAARIVLIASIVRESSPPETTFASGFPAQRRAEARVIHAEGAKLTLDQTLEPPGALGSRLRQPCGFLGGLRGRHGDFPLCFRGDDVVTLQAIESRGDLGSVGGDGRGRFSVLALEGSDGVEPVVDLPQARRIDH